MAPEELWSTPSVLTILISEKISIHTLVDKLQPQLPQSLQPQHRCCLVSSALASHSL